MGFLRCGKRVSYKTGLCRYDSFGPKRVGFGCFPTRFAQVAAAFAGSLACGRCACVRGAWEEGRGGDGVGAMGSCQGVCECGMRDWRRRRPRAGPLPWVPAFARTTVGGPFDRLRARCEARAGVGGGVPPPGAPLDTGFRRYDDGGCGKFERRRRPAPRPCPGFPLSRERRWGGAGAACRFCVGLPHPAPLDSCLRRNDAGSSAGTTVGECGTRGGCGWGREPFDRLRANGISKRACDVGWWGRAAARRTSGYRRRALRRWLRANGSLDRRSCSNHAPMPWVSGSGANGTAPAPLDSCLRRNDARRRPHPAPLAPALGSRFRENDGGGRVRDARGLRGGGGDPSTGSGRTETRIAPTVVVGARGVRGSEWIGLDDGAYAAVHVYGGAGYEAGSL